MNGRFSSFPGSQARGAGGPNGGRGADLATFRLHWVFGFEAIWTEIVAVEKRYGRREESQLAPNLQAGAATSVCAIF